MPAAVVPFESMAERGSSRGGVIAMALLKPRVPIRFESIEKLVNGHDLRSLIVPVEEGLRRFEQLHEDMMSTLCGRLLILRGEMGSVKTTLSAPSG